MLNAESDKTQLSQSKLFAVVLRLLIANNLSRLWFKITTTKKPLVIFRHLSGTSKTKSLHPYAESDKTQLSQSKIFAVVLRLLIANNLSRLWIKITTTKKPLVIFKHLSGTSKTESLHP
jgi:hypothetical protein